MFSHIAVALDESPQSARAFAAGLELAARLNVAISTITIQEPLPSYSAFTIALDSSTIRQLDDDRDRHYQELTQHAVELGQARGIQVQPYLLDGDRVEMIVDFVEKQKIDLLVIGLHRRSLRMSSLWSTVYTLAQDLSCNMLGIH